ncbi:MAG TPA: hypothetical protein VFV85_01055, partial [Conexibacter sp.]|nr:hypothetical protein [Conexibacter sp.]
MTRDLDGAGDDADDAVDEAAWTSAERALLEAALDFYGAAGGVLDYTGRERPQLRRGEGFEA